MIVEQVKTYIKRFKFREVNSLFKAKNDWNINTSKLALVSVCVFLVTLLMAASPVFVLAHLVPDIWGSNINIFYWMVGAQTMLVFLICYLGYKVIDLMIELGVVAGLQYKYFGAVDSVTSMRLLDEWAKEEGVVKDKGEV